MPSLAEGIEAELRHSRYVRIVRRRGGGVTVSRRSIWTRSTSRHVANATRPTATTAMDTAPPASHGQRRRRSRSEEAPTPEMPLRSILGRYPVSHAR